MKCDFLWELVPRLNKMVFGVVGLRRSEFLVTLLEDYRVEVVVVSVL